MRNKIADNIFSTFVWTTLSVWVLDCLIYNLSVCASVLNKVSPGIMILLTVLNLFFIFVLLLLTEELKNTFDVGIEFNNLVYEPEYEDLEHPTTEVLVERIEDAVRVIL